MHKYVVCFSFVFLLALLTQTGCDQFSFAAEQKEVCPRNGNDLILTESLSCSYHENGRLKMEIPIKNGTLEGLTKTYNENGVLESQVPYKNGKAEGLAKFYNENGKLESEVLYKNNKREGLSKTYYESGAIKGEKLYKDGKVEGLAKSYYESGKLESEVPYKNDQREGLGKFYHESGMLEIEVPYKNDQREGLAKDDYKNDYDGDAHDDTKASQWDKKPLNKETLTNSLGMEFVLIPPGKFTNSWVHIIKGKAEKNDFDEDVFRQRVVTISKPFYMGKYEVTQEQWVAVMGVGSNPSLFKGRTKPVEKVSWEDVQVFIQKLNEKEGGKKYRLPTEAEWEHAARAGADTDWIFGKDPADLGKYAWFMDNSQGTTHPVGEKKPNPWGLYDIYGNVLEWVQDWWDGVVPGYGQEGEVTDPTGPLSGSRRVRRGGSWGDPAEECRSAERGRSMPGVRNDSLGFRLAFSPGE